MTCVGHGTRITIVAVARDGLVVTASIETNTSFPITAAGRSVAGEVGTRVSNAAIRCATKLAVLFGHLIFTCSVERIACALSRPRASQIFIETYGGGRFVTHHGRTDAIALDAAIVECTKVIIVTECVVVDGKLTGTVETYALRHVATVWRIITGQA